MSQWKVTQGDNQFAVDGLQDLIDMAQGRTLDAGDMVQPPGATDWIYASEIPALSEYFADADDDDDELDYKGGGMGKVLPAIAVAVLLGVIGVGGLGVIALIQFLPTGNERLIGDGGLSYSQMIVTNAGAELLDAPDPKGRTVAPVAKDSTLDLLAKRGEYYRARSPEGREGWIPVRQVLPMYQLGGEAVQERFDPLYNPDRYVDVANASWIQLPDQEKKDAKVTVFNFAFRNGSAYDMADLVIRVTINNAKGSVLEKREIAITGVIPKKAQTMVGTLKPDPKVDPDGAVRYFTEHTFELERDEHPGIEERWIVGLEVTMEVEDFDTASVDIVELRAIP